MEVDEGNEEESFEDAWDEAEVITKINFKLLCKI